MTHLSRSKLYSLISRYLISVVVPIPTRSGESIWDSIRKEYLRDLLVLVVQQTLANWVCQLASVGTKY